MLVAETSPTIPISSSRGSVNQPNSVCGTPVPEIQSKADVGFHEFVDIFLSRRRDCCHMYDRCQLVAVAVQPLRQVMWMNDVMYPRGSYIAPLFARPEKIAYHDA